MYTLKNETISVYPMERTLNIIGGKWKIIIIFHLFSGKKRFNELRRLIPSITQRMLTRQLRELEYHGIVNRKIYPEIPPKVEYSMTRLGRSLEPILHFLHNWGTRHFDAMED